MKALRRYYKFWAVGPFITFALVLTGCQGLSGGSNGTTTLSLSSGTLNFGNVAVGSGKSLQDTLTNSTSASITINTIQSSSSAFSIQGISAPLVVAPGQTITFAVQFQPAGSGDPTGTISFAGSNGQSYASLAVQGDGVTQGQLSINPGALVFGNVKVGANQSSSVVVSNSGGTNVTLTQATLSGAGFSMNNLALPLSLAPGANASITVTFAPPGTGSYNGSISFATTAAQSNATERQSRKSTVGSDSASQATLTLSGSGVIQGSLSPSASSLSFGNVQVGTGSNLGETLTNNGGSPVTISQAGVTGSGFSIRGLTLPLTLNASQTASFTVVFDPTASGAASGTLTITSNASNSSLAIPLSGSGLTAGALAPSPSSFSFGSIQAGTSKSLSGSVTNSGGESVTIASASVTGSAFSIAGLSLPVTLNAGQTASFNVTFNPVVPGTASGSLTIASNASNGSLSIPLSGTGLAQGDLAPSPASIAFGNVQVGGNTSQSATLTNNGGTTVTVSAASASGTGFSLTGLSLPMTLNAGQSASLTVKFSPATPGAVSGSITITSNGSNPSLSIPLSGTGLSQGSLTSNPASIGFGSVQVGSNSSLSGTLTNNGGSSVTISAASASGTSFSISELSLPLTLNAGQSTSFSVKFAPSSSGSASGSVTITSNASNSSLSVPLSGTGIAQGSLSPSPGSIALGNVTVGTSSSQSEILLNNGGSSVTISSASVTGTGFSLVGLSLPVTLAAGQSTSFTVTFAPIATGTASGNLTVASNGSNSSLSIPVSGTGVAQGALSPNPSSLSLGNVAIGGSASLSETLTNSGGSSVTISEANVSATGFSLSGLTLPTSLSPNQSVTFTATFAPTTSGSASGTLTVVSNGSNPNLNIGLSGTGTATAQLSLSQTSFGFGPISDGSSSSLSANLTATGSSVTVSSATSSNGEFVLSGITLPVTIAAGQSVPFTVTFTPNTPGNASGSLTFTSNASNPSTAQSLSGTGQPWVGLSWQASNGAVSYNVYRKLSTDQNYTQINNGDSATTYNDNNVTAGVTYDYVVTAVDSQNQESSYSSMAQAAIP